MNRLYLGLRFLIMLPIRWIWSFFPTQILRQAVDDQKDALRGHRQTLVDSAGNLRRLNRQVEAGRERVAKLTTQVKHLLESGNGDKAKTLAAQLVIEKRALADNIAQLEMSTTAHEQATLAYQKSQGKIRQLDTQVDQMAVRYNTARMNADINELTATLKEEDASGLLAEAKENLQRKIDACEGSADVARALDGIDEDDTDADIQAVLDELAPKTADVR